ncbi:uncharacterized protein B0J16DRAFT_103286 [Fusarium flagelliforme]|uniref:uncharacterized protein n=1 Tax=Fusarium flagelliforme TaxID=2675880 RepID=UPI001E8D456C|nr:uncharacterized protein B0J16DRAFT_103286 [Fusarium flagelliforme]KAH7188873.1 hypothetical protein B0J16DRAFT_103286 [Fusarium flagelliforme]
MFSVNLLLAFVIEISPCRTRKERLHVTEATNVPLGFFQSPTLKPALYLWLASKSCLNRRKTLSLNTRTKIRRPLAKLIRVPRNRMISYQPELQ